MIAVLGLSHLGLSTIVHYFKGCNVTGFDENKKFNKNIKSLIILKNLVY